MIESSDMKDQQWARLELALWVAALIVTISLGILAVIDVLGAWALVVAGLTTVSVLVVRYRSMGG